MLSPDVAWGCRSMSVTEQQAGPRPTWTATRPSAGPRHLAWTGSYLAWAVLADGLSALAAGSLAGQIRFGGYATMSRGYLLLTLALPAVWCVTMLLAGGYDIRFVGLGSEEFRRVLNAAASVAAIVVAVSYAGHLNLSRAYVGIAMPAAMTLDLAARYRLRKRLHARRGRGACSRRVIAVGHPAAVRQLVATLRRDTYHGLAVVAACLASGTGADPAARDPAAGESAVGVPVAGGVADITRVVDRYRADTVAVLACQEMDSGCLRELAWALEKTGTGLCVAPTLLDIAGPRTSVRAVAGLPLLYVEHPQLVVGKQLLKSAFDKVFAACALLVLAPLFAAVAIAIKSDDRGPVLFRQVRVGRDGTLFTLYKFRSMRVGADRCKQELACRNEASGVLFKLRSDPRVTRTGTWLRRWSLDELPQLVNVLIGDMSLVGPRPALPEETERYCDLMRRRLAVKPGMTGLWQVSGRSDLPSEESLRLDTRYVENWSFALDLQILWKTCSAVLGGAGAY